MNKVGLIVLHGAAWCCMVLPYVTERIDNDNHHSQYIHFNSMTHIMHRVRLASRDEVGVGNWLAQWWKHYRRIPFPPLGMFWHHI